MPGDGVSLPTTIAQMGTVAKTQARGQANPQANPADLRRQDRDEFKVERVKETEKGEKSRINPDDQKKDKRRQRRIKRRLGRQAREDTHETSPQDVHPQDPSNDPQETTQDGRETIGSLVDCRV